LGLFIGIFLAIMLQFFYGGNNGLIVSITIILLSILVGYFIGIKRDNPISNKTFIKWVLGLFLALIISVVIMLLNWP